MNYLLDTHTFLWLLREPSILPANVRQIARERSTKLALSLVTPWEIAIKVNLGKLDAADILNDFDRVVAIGGYSLLETTPAQAIRSGLLPRHHRDPFDRLLVAQALDLRFSIVSCDDIFDLYGVNRVWG